MRERPDDEIENERDARDGEAGWAVDDEPEDEECDCETCGGTGWVWCARGDGGGEIGMPCPEC